jgi:hypothetical protein
MMTDDPNQQSLIHLTRRAAHCRRLAEIATSDGIAAELRVIAQSYEDEANEIELLTVTGRRDTHVRPTERDIDQQPWLVESRAVPK